ncbi:hypothetical protein VT98_10882 [Candidatus Electrothrix communis]|uniref:Uncharacterized protein n=1 Tax=Candidatus Electrothrix communis TaxID=1859133 RepID=A0A3S3UD09_9BACT|nr:hypothetical protein [Desulfobulbus sp. US4]RWX49012.1 hypothetical protein VT98_10882 [Candidatus Electrothrix communis]WLE96645.1 MAG: hypothetical protein QTN59_18425 [Candidatus Electrothrix communis]
MNTTVYIGRVRSDFFLKGIKGKKQYIKGQWVEGNFRDVMGQRMFLADGFFLNPQRFDVVKASRMPN